MTALLNKIFIGYIRSGTLSKLKIQSLYLRLVNLLFKLSKPYKSLKINEENDKIVEKIKEDGIIKIENFLTKEEYDKLLNLLNSLENLEKKTHQGFNYEKRNVSDLILDKFEKFNWISEIAQRFYNLSIINKPRIVYQKQTSEKKLSYNKDLGSEHLHIDRVYKSLKFFFYLTETKKDNFPFCFVKKSNFGNISPQFHDETLKEYKKDSGHYPKINDTLKKKYNLNNEEEIYCKENTLVLADTSGLHRRGSFKVGSQRILLQGSYQGSITPKMFLKNILNRLSKD